jgi:hypothetical protein
MGSRTPQNGLASLPVGLTVAEGTNRTSGSCTGKVVTSCMGFEGMCERSRGVYSDSTLRGVLP